MGPRTLAPAAAALLLLACGGSEGGGEPEDPRPDLQIVRVRMDLMAVPSSKLVAEIRNTGISPARGFDCRCFWSCPGRSLYSTELRIMDDGSLDAGQVGSFSVDAPRHRFGCPGEPTVLDMSCQVDDRGKVEEVEEHNNGWSGSVRLSF
jgi:hypothetical protein